MKAMSRTARSRTACLGVQERQARPTVPGGVRLLEGGLAPIPTTRPSPGPPADAACEAAPQDRACSHTATPRECAPRQEQVSGNDIAQVRRIVKNKRRTLWTRHRAARTWNGSLLARAKVWWLENNG